MFLTYDRATLKGRTVRAFSMLGKPCVGAEYAGNGDAHRLEELGDMEQGEWCLAEQEAELVEDAKKVLLEEMDDAIKRLKGKEAKEAAE